MYGTLVAPGDLAGQVAQVHRNVAKSLAKSLAAAGATFADVVRVTWYAAGWRREMYDAFRAGVEQAREELGITTTPPAALIGVEILAALHLSTGWGCTPRSAPPGKAGVNRRQEAGLTRTFHRACACRSLPVR
jgi:enamine deaminase RidA (YjgF/YER057c/UK114 family)